MSKKAEYTIEHLRLEDIYVDGRFDRSSSSELGIESFAEDIKNNGMHTEIWVNKEDGEFILIAGQRRYLAHLHNKAHEIKCKVYEIERTEALYMTCSENSNRLNYTNHEKIESFFYLVYQEHLLVDKSASTEFNISVYLSALRKSIIKFSSAEKSKKQYKDKPSNQKNLFFDKILQKVMKKSELFASFRTLSSAMIIYDMSPELKKLSVDYLLSAQSVEALAKAEKKLKDEKIVDKKSTNEENALKYLFCSIRALDKKNDNSILNQIAMVNKLVSGQNKKKLEKEEEIKNNFIFAVDDIKNFIKKDLERHQKIKIAKLLQQFTKNANLIIKKEDK